MKKIILTLIIFAFSLSIVSAQENAAKRALAEGDYQAAIKLYKVVIATSNDETQSANIYNEIKNAQKCDELLIQANKAYKKKKYSEAKKLYQSILKYNPSDKFSKKRVSLCSNNTSQQNKSNTSTQNTTTVSKPSKGTANSHEYVDLGLSVNWATCNVGASKPEDYGNYYAWGETSTKSSYTRDNSKTCVKQMNDIKGNSQYDAARANWGGTWRLPTKAELEELKNKCTWKWTTRNGVKGCKVTGPNGNHIFLPATGYRNGSSLYYAGEGGYYWSSTPLESDSDDAYYLTFYSGYQSVNWCDRYYGLSVRPVSDEEDIYKVSVNNGTFTVNGVSFKMIKVEGGTFNMGATSEQGSAAESDEKPVHSVTLSDYYIGETEVTQELWEAVMGSNPSYFKGSQKPVEMVSWNDCKEFIEKLNQLTGKNFRLPTEAEWEYAARGGNKSKGYKYSGSNTKGNVAWYWDNSGKATHNVKTKSPNELGIYDMSGNVYEWCEDWYGNYSSGSQTNPNGPSSGSARVHRGGSWYYSELRCRVSRRNGANPVYKYDNCGFRLALSQ